MGTDCPGDKSGQTQKIDMKAGQEVQVPVHDLRSEDNRGEDGSDGWPERSDSWL